MNPLQKAIEDLKNGRMVIMPDNTDRENEGDLIVAAEYATPDIINFFLNHAKGLLCVALSFELTKKIGLPLHPRSSNDDNDLVPFFTYSIDLKSGISTGVSSYDRTQTINRLAAEYCSIDDFIYPGHVFPIQARRNFLKERQGHTEGAIELAMLTKLTPAIVICEILSDSGTSACKNELQEFSEKYQLNIVSIDMIINEVYSEG